MGGQEVSEESYFGNYKDVSGTKQAMKLNVKHDGKKFIDCEVTDIKLLEKVDDATFAKP
jgi:hypothetical protein